MTSDYYNDPKYMTFSKSCRLRKKVLLITLKKLSWSSEKNSRAILKAKKEKVENK